MKSSATFKQISQLMMDSWIRGSDGGSPKEVYRHAEGLLRPQMALIVVETHSTFNDGFHIKLVKPYEVPTGLDGVTRLQQSRTSASFPDPLFLREIMVPAYDNAAERQRPSIDSVAATLLDIHASYDRIILPQRTTQARSKWCLSVIDVHFLLPRNARRRELDDHDIGILQLLAERWPTREIADRVSLSPRTIEHRIESAKLAFGARNIAHLVSLWISDGSKQWVRRELSAPYAAEL